MVKILIVDDEPMQFDILSAAIGSDYHLDYVESGEDCLQYLEQKTPDLILLDINMSGMDGFDTCQQIKDTPNTENIPVMFISALETTEDKVKGFESGALDYIVKPFDTGLLHTKIKTALDIFSKYSTLQEQASLATSAAMTAMQSSAELGTVIQFIKESFQCHDYENLAAVALNSLNAYGLEALIQLNTSDSTPLYKSSRDIVTPIEQNLMERLKSQDRIFTFNNRCQLNDSHASILLYQVPEDDEYFGRIKDHLAILVEGLSARVEALNRMKAFEHQKSKIMAIISGSKEALQAISSTQFESKVQLSTLFRELQHNIENSFSFLGLDEQQEQQLLATINNVVERAIRVFDDQANVDKHFTEVIQSLRSIG